MKAVALLVMVALAGCGRSDQAWAEGDTTAFPLTTPGTPVKVEQEVIRLPGIAVGDPGDELLVEEPAGAPPTIETEPGPPMPPLPPPPPEQPPTPRDTGQALLL